MRPGRAWLWMPVLTAALPAFAAKAADGRNAMKARRASPARKAGIAEILSTKVICKQKGRYIGWPTICRRANGQLVVIFSGDRDAHVCPYGKDQLVRSTDGGKTWTKPETVNNTPLDDRDAGILETRRGTLLVSWFTSLAFERNGRPHWRRHAEKLGPETRKRWLGSWVRRSTDGGKTWQRPVRVTGSAPHGPIELADGRLLYLGSDNFNARNKVVAEASRDDGKTWKVVGSVPIPKRLQSIRFCEPHVVETRRGKLVGMFRVEEVPFNGRFLYQADSHDGGKTWTPPRRTKIWGFPPHLLRLANGWLVVVYGRRRPPFGQRACISRDDGKTWDVANEITLARGPNGDLGYPASVQLPDGSILTVFYQIDKPGDGEKTSLFATHWRLPPAGD